MTKYLLAAAIAVTFSALMPGAPASAAEYPWCAQYGGSDGGRNCGFVSYQQCHATVNGMGGYCERNRFYTPTSTRGRN
jgi:hypothetical protein